MLVSVYKYDKIENNWQMKIKLSIRVCYNWTYSIWFCSLYSSLLRHVFVDERSSTFINSIEIILRNSYSTMLIISWKDSSIVMSKTILYKKRINWKSWLFIYFFLSLSCTNILIIISDISQLKYTATILLFISDVSWELSYRSTYITIRNT